MRDAALVGGVLGLGCAVVFALAATVWMLFPNGALVASNPWGGGMAIGRAMPAPGLEIDPVMIEVPGDGAEK